MWLEQGRQSAAVGWNGAQGEGLGSPSPRGVSLRRGRQVWPCSCTPGMGTGWERVCGDTSMGFSEIA